MEVKDPYNTARLVRLQAQSDLHVPISGWENGMVNRCHLKALLNRGADHTNKNGEKNVFVVVNTYSCCARQQTTSPFQALAGARVVASQLGHSHLIALCFLAISQVGH